MNDDVPAIFEADAQFQKGKLVLERGHLPGALRLFDQAAAVILVNHELNALRAYCAWECAHRSTDARVVLEAAERLLAEQPRCVSVLAAAALAQHALGNEKAAREMLALAQQHGEKNSVLYQAEMEIDPHGGPRTPRPVGALAVVAKPGEDDEPEEQ